MVSSYIYCVFFLSFASSLTLSVPFLLIVCRIDFKFLFFWISITRMWYTFLLHRSITAAHLPGACVQTPIFSVQCVDGIFVCCCWNCCCRLSSSFFFSVEFDFPTGLVDLISCDMIWHVTGELIQIYYSHVFFSLFFSFRTLNCRLPSF